MVGVVTFVTANGETLNLSIIIIYDIPDYPRQTQEIYCVELDKTFPSVRDVIDYLKLPYNKRLELKNSIKKNN